MSEDMVCVLSCFRISRGRIARILPALELKRLHPTVALLQLTPLQRRRKAKKKTGKLEAQKLEDEKQLVRLGALDLPFTIMCRRVGWGLSCWPSHTLAFSLIAITF